MKKIALDLGHAGKVKNPRDRGAVYNDTRESDLVLLYAISARSHLEKEGHIVYLLCHDEYRNRKRFCKDIGIELHMQLHLNSAEKPGKYSLVEYREANRKKCETLAKIIGTKFSNNLPVSKNVIKTLKDKDRGYSCLMSTIPSLLIEPLFLNNKAHYKEMIEEDLLFTIGKILAEGVLEWIDLKEVK
jgi:N-acetylmuramoyl-L-alanine amidase